MKTLLIATTALLSVTSAVAGPLPAPEPPSRHYGLDANDKFLCDYGGYYYVSFSAGFSEHALLENWTRGATPVKGKSETVSGIEVGDSFYSPRGGYLGLSVGIYSSRHNQPFKLLAGAWQAAYSCPVTLSVGPIRLQQGKKYWIVEKAEPSFGSPSDFPSGMWGYEWFYRTTNTHDAKWQSGSSSCTPSYPYQECHLLHSGAWQSMTGGTPSLKLITSAQTWDSNKAQTGGPPPDHKINHVFDGNPTPLPTREGSRGPP